MILKKNIAMDSVVKIEKIGTSGNIAKLLAKGTERDISLVPGMLVAFDKLFRENIIYFIIDLQNINELPPSLIVMLFEITAKARRRGGDVQILHLGKLAYQDLVTFNPLSYLDTSENEDHAVVEFEERIKIDQQYNTFNDRVSPQPPVSAPQVNNVSTPVGMPQKNYIEIPSKVSDLYRVSTFVLNIAGAMGFSEGDRSRIKIAVYEGCLNAIEHAYHSDPQQIIKVVVENTTNKLEISIIDYGPGFEVDTTKEFDVIKAAMERNRGGMGLHIIQRSMDSVRYDMDQFAGNKLVMTKYLDKVHTSNSVKSAEPQMSRNNL